MTVPLEALLCRMSRMIETIFNDAGEIELSWLIETESGEQRFIVAPFWAPDASAAHEYKDTLAASLRQQFAEMNVVRYVQAAECWLSPTFSPHMDREEFEQRYGSLGYTLANAPDRQEIIGLTADDGRRASFRVARHHSPCPRAALSRQAEQDRAFAAGRTLYQFVVAPMLP